MRKILFITPYPPGEAASQRFRFEQYLGILKDHGFEYQISSFLDHHAWKILYQKGHFISKCRAIVKGYLRRIKDVFRMGQFDYIFIHREASPFGFPVFEWLFLKASGKTTVFDFDDAIWIPNASESNWMSRYLKRYSNANNCCRWATVVSAGNKFLADHASKYNKNVFVNPTTIDTDEHHNETTVHNNHVFTIGWTGSHSTVQYLDEVYSVLAELEKKFSFELHVIGDVPPRFKLKSLKFIRWSKESEINDLLNFNVGIMPLPENVWAYGKCGFKALQYMALGIPAVVSNVGVNANIVDHDVNGCICKTKEDWYNNLSRLITDKNYLLKLSNNTREKVLRSYSVESNKENFLKLFNMKKH